MNIRNIMTDLIGRQKISKRLSSTRKSRASRRSAKTSGKFNSAKSTEVFNKFKIKIRRRPKTKKIINTGSEQKIVKRFSLNKKLDKLFENIRNQLSRKRFAIFLSAGFFVVLVAAAGIFISSYIEKMSMFDEFSLHTDYDINDVLYESLPSDYNGQGSGEIAGIEPVLLTSGEPMNYTVKKGDTLSEISKNNNIKIGTLISFNKISDVRRLQVGMELKIPEVDGVPYEVKAGDSLSSIAKNHNISINSILDANDMDTDILNPGEILFIPGAAMNEYDYKKAMGTLFIYPTSGRLSSGFGYRPDPFTGHRRFHNGIDLANASGTRIAATMSGRVADVGDRPTGYGKYVIIKHSNGYQSLYGHMSKITVRVGQYVSQNEKIGEMGNTGRSTGPHLHFSIYKNNSPVNPKTYLW